jgi:hypothetical protein
VIRQEFRRSKPRRLPEVIGNDHLSGLESAAGRGFQVDARRDLANHPPVPTRHACTHQQPLVYLTFTSTLEPRIATRFGLHLEQPEFFVANAGAAFFDADASRRNAKLVTQDSLAMSSSERVCLQLGHPVEDHA